jgi:radical SAM superfamily enzyme YgiQ (UPF0313 family)
MRKRVLVVNTFFDEYRRTSGSPFRVPRAMGHVYLAGAFNRHTTDVRIFSEQYGGPLADLTLLAWPDMLVMTGVTSSFNRMRHLAAYARTLNPKVVVVAGGPAVRVLRKRSARYFDYACQGDIEELSEVAREVLGPSCVAEEMFPRYDLAEPGRFIGYVESTRHCNFACSFCSLTAENSRYQTYDLDFVRRQLDAVGNKQILFIDNNFYGKDLSYFRARVELARDYWRSGRIKGWSALVTGDFFAKPENLDLVAEAGCISLFSGVESFDTATLIAHRKRQNTIVPQVEMIRSCLKRGVLFNYGVMLDPSTRRLKDLHKEIRFIIETDEITLPAFFTLAIPLLGTPYFHDCVRNRRLLPGIRLRDLNGVTLALTPRDPLDSAVAFARDLVNLRGYRRSILRRTARFVKRYRRHLSPAQLAAAAGNAALTTVPGLASAPLSPRWRRPPQTFLASTEVLDPLFTPIMPLPARFEEYFRPTMVTDAEGNLADDVVDDLGRAFAPTGVADCGAVSAAE